jgi:glycosyltransferase involved in cell wall biosynthesis
MGRRILYVQFTDPAAYPPVEHSAVVLAKQGWDVLLLGTWTLGNLEVELPAHPRIRVQKLGFVSAGWKQKLNYAAFFLWCVYWTLRWRPQWIYASDPLAAPLAWLLQRLTKVRIAYHEHDSPNVQEARSGFMNQVFAFRARLGRAADVCLLPQRERLLYFLEETQRSKPTFCVWNCPRLDEIPEDHRDQVGDLVMHYHGSINRARLPAQLIIAACRLSRSVRLQIAGYQTEAGYVEELRRLAAENGAAELIEYCGVVRRRSDLFRCASLAHLGVSIVPKHTDDINLRHMVGASNKAFDYMACGLPLLVSDLPDWVSTFVEPGYALACDPNDVDSIETALRLYFVNFEERREMGRKCRDKIRQSWNYEIMFAPVLELIKEDGEMR